MDLELVIKILVKLTVNTMIGFRAGSKFNMPFHVMDTGSLANGHCPQPVLPGYKIRPFPCPRESLLFHGFIGTAGPGHGPVKLTAITEKIFITIFFADNPCLHPEAFGPDLLF